MNADLIRAMMQDPAAFRRSLLISTDAGPARLADVATELQQLDFAAADPAWQSLAGVSGAEPEHRRFYLERGRGSSKTGDLAVAAAWALFASRRRLRLLAGAGDLDQAKLLRDSIDGLLYLNPWLSEVLQADRHRVWNRRTGGELLVLSADAPTAYGFTPHAVLCDELANWPDSGERFWHALITSAAKRRDCIVVIITNSGWLDGWQWPIREHARQNWYFHRWPGPAAWLDPAALEEQRRILPAQVYRRLFENDWTTARGSALSEEDIRGAVVFDGPMVYREPEYEGWMMGLDLAETRDHAALVIVAMNFATGKLRVASVLDWPPPIDTEDIYRAILDARRQFGVRFVASDYWQTLNFGQRLQREGFTVAVHKGSTGSSLMATSLLQVFKDKRLELYDEPLLIRDLMHLELTERSYGFKLESKRDEHGHGDRASALAAVVPFALEGLETLTPNAQRPSDGLGSNLLDYVHRQERRANFGQREL